MTSSFEVPLVSLLPPPPPEAGCNRFEVLLIVREQFFRRLSVVCNV